MLPPKDAVRIEDLLKKVFQGFRQTHPAADVASRVFCNIEDMMKAWP